MKAILHVLGFVLLVQLTGCASSLSPAGSGAIGAGLVKHRGYPMVVRINPGSVAEQSGQILLGDLILAAAPTPESQWVILKGYGLNQAIHVIRGQPYTRVKLKLMNNQDSQEREVVLIRGPEGRASELTYLEGQKGLDTQGETAAPVNIADLVISDNSGPYLSPYTSDGVTAEWVNKAINTKMGEATGSAVGAAAGAYAGRKLMENVPGGGFFGSFLGGMAGSKSGKAVGRDAAIKASGGWEYIRATSDQSFHSVGDMARWLVNTHGGSANFKDVIDAASHVYPDLQPALARQR
ncbi:hypothetical protein [Alcanivorax sp. 24]|uniref:hypothetical protein n=1 Tax=Alcanivorax sp. 24 TaxID=2545266 RepID=UPI00105EC360|nr:hypothetical protein [Alcanivorax sp. 24]